MSTVSAQALSIHRHNSHCGNPLHALSSNAGNPDAELLALGRDFEAVCAELADASAEADRLYKVAKARRPAPFKGMRFQKRDKAILGETMLRAYPPFCDMPTGIMCWDKPVVETFRKALAMPRRNMLMDEASANRAQEIIAAYDAWKAAWDAVNEEIGFRYADAQADALNDEAHALVKEMRSIPARTREGRQVKLNAMRWMYRDEGIDEIYGGETTDVQMAFSIVRDLLREEEEQAQTASVECPQQELIFN